MVTPEIVPLPFCTVSIVTPYRLPLIELPSISTLLIVAAASGVETLKIWQAVAEPAPKTAQPGTVLSADASGVRVACGEGQLCLMQLQRPGGKRLSAADFLRGCPLQPGQRLVA